MKSMNLAVLFTTIIMTKSSVYSANLCEDENTKKADEALAPFADKIKEADDNIANAAKAQSDAEAAS